MPRLLLPIRILLVIALAIVVWASLSQTVAISGPQHSDKAAHFIAYFGLTFLGLTGFRTPRNEILFVGFCLLLGAAMEYGQSFVPGRSMSWADMLANSLGILGAVLLYWPLRNWIGRILGRGEETEVISAATADIEESSGSEKVR